MKCLKFPQEEVWNNLYVPHMFVETYIDDVYKLVRESKFNIIVDAGANIGVISLFFAQYCKMVYAFEPLPSLYNCLKENIEANEITNIIPTKMAISDFNGQAAFEYNPGNVTMGRLKDTGDRIVETTTIESFMKVYKIDEIDYFKMDIESGEARVILDPNFKNVARKIKNLFVALHGEKEEEIKQRVQAYGFTMQHLPTLLGERIYLFRRK